MIKHTKIYLLPGIIIMLLIAIFPAAFADRIYSDSEFSETQSGEKPAINSQNSLAKLLDDAAKLEKKDDFKSALHLYNSAISLARQKKDKVMENYLMRKKGSMFLISNQLDSANTYFLLVNDFARKKEIDSTLAKVLVNQGYLADLSGYNNDCLLYYDSALVIFNKMKDTLGIASVMNNISLFYKDRGEYDKALEYALKNERLLSSLEDTMRYVAGLITLGNVYEKLEEYDSAMAIYKHSNILSREHGYKGYINTSLTNIAVCYFRQNKYDDAEVAYNSAIDYAIEIDDKASLVLLYTNIGTNYRYQGKYDQSLHYYLNALQIAEELNDSLRMISVLNNLGITSKKEKKYEQAINYYQKSLSLAQKTNKKDAIRKAYGNLASLYEDIGDYKSAFANLQLKSAWQDSLMNQEKVKAIENMKAKYEKEKDLEKIKALKEKISYERKIMLSISISAVIILLILLLYFRMKSRKNKIIAQQRIQKLEDEKRLMESQSVMIGEENERKRIAQELHDGIGVLLSTASIQFSGITSKVNDPGTIELIDKAGKFLKEAGQEVRKISQNMMPSVLSKFGLREALEDIFDEMEDLGNIDTNILIESDSVRLPENMEIMIYRVVQELANNAIKHAKPTKIIFSFIKKADIIEIDFQDNGIGFDPESLPHNKSLGIYGLRSRVNYLKGTIELESSPGEGTKYHILIPVAN